MNTIKIETLGAESALFINGTPVAMLTDDQLIELTKAAGQALHAMRNRRAAESASHAMHAARIAANTTRAADLTGPVDLEL